MLGHFQDQKQSGPVNFTSGKGATALSEISDCILYHIFPSE
jgi:hypothetical protein